MVPLIRPRILHPHFGSLLLVQRAMRCETRDHRIASDLIVCRQTGDAGSNRTVHIDPLPGIFPNYTAPVVRHAADGEREMALMSWGFPLLQAGKAPRRVTNVRDDKILTSSFWRPSFEQRRCLVPATSFCEPNGDVKPATWHWFAIKGDDPRPLFAFAGVWRRYKGPIKKDGPSVELEVYSFLTTTPNPLVETINHERMPVLLTTEDEFALGRFLRSSLWSMLAMIDTQKRTTPKRVRSLLRYWWRGYGRLRGGGRAPHVLADLRSGRVAKHVHDEQEDDDEGHGDAEHRPEHGIFVMQRARR